MRLRPEKVRDLAALAVVQLRADPQVKLIAPEDAVRVAVAGVFLDNLAEEDEIERAAELLLAQHKDEIARGDLDVDELRHRFKRELAKRRGFRL